MIICAIVGVRKSGKTTTVTGLVRELKARGHRVGTVKSVFCPEFSIDTPGSNTWKHREAGADLVCVKGKKETDLIMGPAPDGALYESFPVDILLLEGEYELAVPRIICARKEEEVKERLTDDTIAAAGRIADERNECLGIRVFHSINEIGKLADLVAGLEDAVFPLGRHAMPENVSSFCQCGCHKAAKKQKEQNDASSDVDLRQCEELGGEEPLMARPSRTDRKHIFLTGPKRIGKSTVLDRVISELDDVVGFQTLPYEINGKQRGFYLHSLTDVEDAENDCPVVVRLAKGKMTAVPETFRVLGTAIAEAMSKTPEKIALMDELGKAERDVPEFQRAIFRVLDTRIMVIGVLQANTGAFTEAVAARPDVKVIEVTEENRDGLPELLLAEIRRATRRPS